MDRLIEQGALELELESSSGPPSQLRVHTGEGLEQNFELPAGVLEADVEGATETGSDTAVQRSASFGRMDHLIEQDAQLLELEEAAGASSVLRAQAELGRDAERGLEAEIQREIMREDAAVPEDIDVPPSPGNCAKQECEGGQRGDPYERQLENEIEDHLCELRLQERQRLRGGGMPPPEAATAKNAKRLEQAFIPPVREVPSDFTFDG